MGSDFFYVLVEKQYDFSDEEIVENFMSFLKGLAANLTEDLLLGYVIRTKFAIFSKAFIFFGYLDPMIKNAARTVILTIIKRICHIVNNPKIFEFLIKNQFTLKMMERVIFLWEKLDREIPTEEKIRIENFVSAISDDLCYINDLIEHVEELNYDICNRFLSLAMPWLVSNINSQFKTGNLNFIPAGFVIFSILEHIKCSFILNMLVTGLFANKITEKIQCFITKGEVLNNQFDFLVEDCGRVENIVKHQIIAFLNEPKNANMSLLILNSIVSNEIVCKKVMYECQLLRKEEIKCQQLLRKVLQDTHEYSSDPLLVDLLIKSLTGDNSFFTMFLSFRLIYHCNFQPRDYYFSILQSEINREVILSINTLLQSISTETCPEMILDTFDEEYLNISSLNFNEKISFPETLLSSNETTTPLIYRLPLTRKEIYHWNFSRYFLFKKILSLLFSSKTGANLESQDFLLLLANCGNSGPNLIVDCTISSSLEISDLFLNVITEKPYKKMTFKLRHVEVMLNAREPCALSLIFNQPKQSTSIKVNFTDEQVCKSTKKLIETKRKESKEKELVFIKIFLSQESKAFRDINF